MRMIDVQDNHLIFFDLINHSIVGFKKAANVTHISGIVFV